MKAYINDMLVKSVKASNCIKDLEETFNMLQRHQMKLNLIKYIFEITTGKFLEFLVTNQGIETNLEKMTILDMKPPFTKNEV